jgi:hypothetical protein
MALWRVGVTVEGTMWSETDGVLLASEQGTIPKAMIRSHKLLGESAYQTKYPLDGVVLGLKVTNYYQSSCDDMRKIQVHLQT